MMINKKIGGIEDYNMAKRDAVNVMRTLFRQVAVFGSRGATGARDIVIDLRLPLDHHAKYFNGRFSSP